MKILSLNIREWSRDLSPKSPHFWKNRMRKMEKMLEREDADILCFQEMTFPANLYVPKGYKRLGWMPNHPIYVKKSFGYIMTDWGIHYSKAVVFPPNMAGSIQIVNIHSHWDANVIRRTMETIKRLKKAHLGSTIAIGDFNNELKVILNYYPYVSAREHLGMERKETFQNFTKEESHGEIDHAFVFYAEPKRFEVLDDELSDHKAIVCEI